MGESKVGTLGAGAVLTAIGASACCVLPPVLGFLGAGSVALAARLEPYRPLFIALTAVFLGLGFYQASRKRLPPRPAAPRARKQNSYRPVQSRSRSSRSLRPGRWR